jgi:hypothetical protein
LNHIFNGEPDAAFSSKEKKHLCRFNKKMVKCFTNFLLYIFTE